jgi:hypothetical protein
VPASQSAETTTLGSLAETSAPAAESLATTVPPSNPAPPPASVGPPGKLHSPKKGSAERKAILDALRVPVEKDLKQPVIFEIAVIQAQGNWAYVRATPLTPNGNPINYSKTKYKVQIDAGAFDDAVDALLEYRDGSWRVAEYVIGATDVVWMSWPEQYGAPRAIFPWP